MISKKIKTHIKNYKTKKISKKKYKTKYKTKKGGTNKNSVYNLKNTVKPEYIGEGAYGYVYSPPFKCPECLECNTHNNKDLCKACDSTINVSKILSLQHATIEYEKYEKLGLENISGTDTYYIKPLLKCSPTDEETRKIKREIKETCAKRTNKTENKTVQCDKDKVRDELALIIYKNGGMSLDKLLKEIQKKHISITFVQILTALKNILLALLELGNHKIIHFDIKPENIVTGIYTEDDKDKMIFKIIDFGISQKIPIGDIQTSEEIDKLFEELDKLNKENNQKQNNQTQNNQTNNKIIAIETQITDKIIKDESHNNVYDFFKDNNTISDILDYFNINGGIIHYVMPPYTFLISDQFKGDFQVSEKCGLYQFQYLNQEYLKNLQTFYNQDENIKRTIESYTSKDYKTGQICDMVMAFLIPYVNKNNEFELKIPLRVAPYNYNNNNIIKERHNYYEAKDKRFYFNYQNTYNKVIKMFDLYSFGLLLLYIIDFFPDENRKSIYEKIKKFLLQTQILYPDVNTSFELREQILKYYDEMLST